MQISALNLIIAAQQARQAGHARAPSAPLKVEPPEAQAQKEFVPFSAEIGQNQPSSPATAQISAPAPMPPGSQVDIRV